MLKINNYNSEILHDISFEIKDNLIILGSNGAGKSTLSKVMCGIIDNDNILLNNKKITNYTSKEKTQWLNYIPSKLDIFDEYMSVEEFLQLSFIQKDLSKTQEVLDALDLTHLKDHACQTLSSGESQLLLLASAIAHNAHITFLDEPTSNLDQKRVKKVYELLKKGNHLKTKVIITHDLNLAFNLGYDVLFIQEGKIAYEGESQTFFSEHNLKQFFGDAVKRLDNCIVSNLS